MDQRRSIEGAEDGKKQRKVDRDGARSKSCDEKHDSCHGLAKLMPGSWQAKK